ncbi:hypothetical protein [Marinobacter sp.]|uniref:hypothetical protein n=1 Tax=Marinobacter sp. TaxID=50741 RepID=UPI00384EFDF9
MAMLLVLTFQMVAAYATEHPLVAISVWVLSLVVGAGFIFWLTGPLRETLARARSIIDDPVAEKIFTGRLDDIGSIELALTQQAAELDAVVKRFARYLPMRAICLSR